MTQTFNQDVAIVGSSDVDQLRVKGVAAQSQPLQTWETSTGTVLTQITSDGRILTGDDVGLTSPDALVEAHRSQSSGKPKRGFHSKGLITAVTGAIVSWIIQELEVLGSAGIDTLHRALRVSLTNQNTGTTNNGADLRAGDFEIINSGGASGVNGPISKMTGIQVGVTNNIGANADEAVGIRIVLNNAGTISKIYSVYADAGVLHIGAEQEVLVLGAPPSANPPANFIKIYPKAISGAIQLFALNESGIETQLTGTGGGGGGGDTGVAAKLYLNDNYFA